MCSAHGLKALPLPADTGLNGVTVTLTLHLGAGGAETYCSTKQILKTYLDNNDVRSSDDSSIP